MEVVNHFSEMGFFGSSSLTFGGIGISDAVTFELDFGGFALCNIFDVGFFGHLRYSLGKAEA
jgi:hypothetical protein